MDGSDQVLKASFGELTGDTDFASPDLIGRVLDLYYLAEDKRSAADTDAFGTVLEQMAYAVETEKRAELANRLALDAKAPHRLMRRLAFDNIIVARPVLQYSPCLSDTDLVTLATKLDQDHLLAIAHRRSLAVSVTDVLIQRGTSPVHVTIVTNAGAAFSPAGLSQLSDQAGGDGDLRLALDLRPDLNRGLLTRVRNYLSEQFLDQLAREMSVDDEETVIYPTRKSEIDAVDEAGMAADKADAGSLSTDADLQGGMQGDDDDLAEMELARAGAEAARDAKASETNIAELARSGLVPETIASMAQLTRLEDTMVEHCLLRAELSALMVLCKANGFAHSTFSALLNLRETHGEGGPIDTIAMLKRYEAMKAHTAKRIIQYADKKKN